MDRSTRKRLLIVGGTTRAAAWSAVRAGFQPVCADLFADVDTRQVAEIIDVESYPNSIPDDVAQATADAWLYTGALENHPELLERIAQRAVNCGPMLGCSTATLRLVRDPFWMAETLRSVGLPALAVCPQSSPPPADGTWLQKPIASGGGRRIRFWNESAVNQPFGESYFFQEFSEGEPMSAVFWCDGGRCRCLGATRQLINLDISAAPELFGYCGSVGPITLREQVLSRLDRIVAVLAEASGLRGLFGLDFLMTGDEIVPVELNPRYPASAEILEFASETSVIGLYADWIPRSDLEAGDSTGKAPPRIAARAGSQTFAKVIIYATQTIQAPDFGQVPGLPAFAELQKNEGGFRIPLIADVPPTGQIIQPGWPICTVMSRGNTISETLNRAQCQVAEIRAWLLNSTREAGVLDPSDIPR